MLDWIFGSLLIIAVVIVCGAIFVAFAASLAKEVFDSIRSNTAAILIVIVVSYGLSFFILRLLFGDENAGLSILASALLGTSFVCVFAMLGGFDLKFEQLNLSENRGTFGVAAIFLIMLSALVSSFTDPNVWTGNSSRALNERHALQQSQPEFQVIQTPSPVKRPVATIETIEIPATPAPKTEVSVTQTKSFATEEEAKKVAVSLYPDLGIAGSPMNKEFVARYRTYKQTRPDFFYDNAWPVRLADEIKAESKLK